MSQKASQVPLPGKLSTPLALPAAQPPGSPGSGRDGVRFIMGRCAPGGSILSRIMNCNRIISPNVIQAHDVAYGSLNVPQTEELQEHSSPKLPHVPSLPPLSTPK